MKKINRKFYLQKKQLTYEKQFTLVMREMHMKVDTVVCILLV